MHRHRGGLPETGCPPVVVLAGGRGTRMAEETETRPKPMADIGGQPILWHIMRHYRQFGFREFFLALGYRGDVIRRYFLDYRYLNGDVTVDLHAGTVTASTPAADDWVVHLVDTGLRTNTGGRLRRLRGLLPPGPFLLTYGDGLADVDIGSLLAFHRAHGRAATVTAVRPPARFGTMRLNGELVEEFTEKPPETGWINGGFMVLGRQVFEYLCDDRSVLEHALERLAAAGQLAAYRHLGFWQCMDTPSDRRHLVSLWQEGSPPWVLR